MSPTRVPFLIDNSYNLSKMDEAAPGSAAPLTGDYCFQFILGILVSFPLALLGGVCGNGGEATNDGYYIRIPLSLDA